jgi:2-polyprenyl-3-methyl-5-hydroxy-6-metoxy-1,4-benzoquinol methylase
MERGIVYVEVQHARATNVSSCRCECYESQFDDKHAAKDLKRYRRRGPDKTTRLLLDGLKMQGVQGASLLDIGGGVGVVHHELLAAGAQAAVHVDATASNIRAAEEEATHRGHAGRVTFLHGDFVALAPEIPLADVVTLDRVICCYPDMEQLVAASASHARRLYGAVFPRERWFLESFLALGNFVRRMRGNAFRTYVHPIHAIDAALQRQGLTASYVHDTFVWRVSVYSR